VNDCILKILSDSRQKRMTQNFTIRQARPEDDAARATLLAPTYGADAAGLAAAFGILAILRPGSSGWWRKMRMAQSSARWRRP
jgi:hypothetical protein